MNAWLEQLSLHTSCLLHPASYLSAFTTGFVIQKHLLHNSAATHWCVPSNRRGGCRGRSIGGTESERCLASLQSYGCRQPVQDQFLRRLDSSETISPDSLLVVAPDCQSKSKRFPPQSISFFLFSLCCLVLLVGPLPVSLSSFPTRHLQTESPADIVAAQPRCARTCQFGLWISQPTSETFGQGLEWNAN